jgi:hypothetical protein
MYQRALQDYEKAVGVDNVTTYSPALNKIGNLGSFFEREGDIAKARTMYSKAFIGNEIVFGPDHRRSQYWRDKASALDIVIKNMALIGVGSLWTRKPHQNQNVKGGSENLASDKLVTVWLYYNSTWYKFMFSGYLFMMQMIE